MQESIIQANGSMATVFKLDWQMLEGLLSDWHSILTAGPDGIAPMRCSRHRAGHSTLKDDSDLMITGL
jgi:hypothetical protein